MFSRSLVVLGLTLAAVLPAGAFTDEDRGRGRISVTVFDQTGAVIPNASVALEAHAAEPGQAPIEPVLTGGTGVAVLAGLPEGRYAVRVEFPGFEPAVVRDVRVRADRDARVRVTLRIEKLDEVVNVGRDGQTKSLDPQGAAFSSVLTREQIDALPDDPDEMQAALEALAPPGSVIRVDGFTGGRLPSKSQIRSIRLPRMDMFAAQNHGGMSGALFIDIMTMPGNGPLRGRADFHFLDDALNARGPFASTKGAEQLRQYGYGVSGTIVPNRTSFSIDGGGSSRYASPNLLAVLPGGGVARETVRQPTDGFTLSARLDQAINKDHALRATFDRETASSHDLGVGGFDLLARAYDTRSSASVVRLSENGPLGRRLFTDTRLQVRWSDSSSRSAVESPTVRVQDAFTAGGAQRRGGQEAAEIEVASDLDYVRGAHSWRTGFQLEAGRFRADDMTNYLGTYTFASLADYAAGRPASYTRRVGDPAVGYWTTRAAVYLQDDWRASRSLLLSPGIRYGLQGRTGGRLNLSPRFSAAWSPLRSGKLTLRASYGYFYDWIADDLYKQALLVDGSRIRELNATSPSFPEPGAGGSFLPSNRYVWPDDLALPNAHRLSLGFERTLSKNSRLNVNYSGGWGRGLTRGRNLNAPVAGARPDPSSANVVELASDAASRSHALSTALSLARLDLHQLFLVLHYTWSRSESNAAGGFSLPAGGDSLDAEWGPSAGDARHRLGASLIAAPVKNLRLGLNVRARSGLPYDITTGRDDNGDGVFNDRPAGVSRNAARGTTTIDLGGRLSYSWGFGQPRAAGADGPRVAIHREGDGLSPGFGGGAEDKRYRVEIYLTGQNLLNRSNHTAFSFVMTSPLYGQPVAAALPRKLQAGVRFTF